jgi:hypothetical protein
MAQAEIFSINVQPIVDQMKVLGTSISQTKDQLSKLTEEEKKNTDEGIALTTTLKAQQKEYNSLSTVVTNQKSAVNELGKATKSNTDLMNLESNSIATNRKLYNALYGEIVNTTAATDAERKALDKKIEKAKQVNDVLKNQEKALGDTRRNVGNYAESLQSVIGGLTSAIPATKGFGAAQQGVNMVLSANPIGGVITLLFALKEIFSSNAEVADELEFALAGVNKVFSVLVDFIVDGVKQLSFLGDAFEKPGETIKKLGELLQENLLNRFKALGGFVEAISQVFEGDFSKAAETAANAALQLGTGVQGLGTKIKTSFAEGRNASKILDDLNKTIGLNELAISKNNIAINKNKELLAQKGKDDEIRKKAAQEIIRLEQENSNKRVNIARVELQALNEELKGRTLSGEQELEILRAQAKIEQETADGIAATRKAAVEIEKLLNGEKKQEDGKALADKKAYDAQILADKKAYDAQILALEDEFQKSERDRLEDSFQKKQDLVTGNSEAEKNLRRAIGLQQIEALKKFDEDDRKRIKDAEDKKAQAQIARDAETFNKQVALNDKLLKNDLDLVDLSVDSEENKNKRKQEIQIKYLKDQIELTKKFFGELSAEEEAQLQSLQNALDKLLNPTKKEGRETFASALGINEEELGKAQTELQGFQQAVSAVGTAINSIYELRLQTIENQKNSEIDAVNASALNEEEKKAKIAQLNKKYAMEQYKIQKEQFEVNKAVQIVQAIIGGALGIINAISQLGPIAGAIAAVAVAATTAAQIGIISSQKPPPPPKFAKGVIGLRGAGTSTSDNIDAKLSRGESVMTAKATEAFADQLAMMELAVGNKPNYQFGKGRFATGFIPTTDGGFSARQTAQSSLNSVAMAETVISAVRSIPAPVLEYSEFTRFTNGVNKSVQVSEL